MTDTANKSQAGARPAIGQPLGRVDGRVKVMGQATYTAEWDLPGLLHAVLVTSPVGRTHIESLDTHAALVSPGVIAVLDHRNARPAGKIENKPAGAPSQGPPLVPDPSIVLRGTEVPYAGQPVAIVIADTLEQARAAAQRVSVRYAPSKPETELEQQLGHTFAPKSIMGEPPDYHRGDFKQGWAAGEAHVDQVYSTAAESHNPMEPHATVASYKGGKLTLYDATQHVYGVKRTLAHLLGLAPEQVRVICPYVGGAFGSKGLQWPHVTCAALASVHVGRPIKLAVERREMFGFVGFRPRTRQHIRLAAKMDGALTAVSHDAISQTSRFGDFVEPCAVSTKMLYACPNLSVSHRLVRLDTQTPTFQRGPGESSGSCGMEIAMDELAYALALDPLALRLKNYARHDEEKQQPFSSKALLACYQQGAAAFGWHRRTMAPGSMRQGHMRVGWGMATATYPTNRSGASAHVKLTADGKAVVQTASHDLGTGTYTILTQVAADALGVHYTDVLTQIGDTDYPEAPVAGGSQSAASASSAVHAACLEVREKLLKLALADAASPLHGEAASNVLAADGRFRLASDPSRSDAYTAILARNNRKAVEAEQLSKPGEEKKEFSMHAWGAQFAEVHVDPDLCTVRVTRMVGAFAGGRVLNPKTARSQLMGGMVMGLGMALLEEVVRDPRQGRVVNGSLADYLVPVNADIPPIEVIFVHEDDPHVNPLGIKGLGELGIVGSGAAIANAVYHATGTRLRTLPIRLEQLL